MYNKTEDELGEIKKIEKLCHDSCKKICTTINREKNLKTHLLCFPKQKHSLVKKEVRKSSRTRLSLTDTKPHPPPPG